MSEVDNNLNTILEVEVVGEVTTIEPEIVSQEVIVPTETLPAVIPDDDDSRDVQYDYEYSRETHRELIDQGQEALTDLLKVAKESQHPRAYEVAANMLKSLSDMTDKLMVLQEKKQSIEGKKGGGSERPSQINIDKAVFTGSTADLLKQIKSQ